MKKQASLLSLVVWYLPVLVVQLVSARITVGGLNPWYQSLIKAAWNPPAWLFGPVWTLLYILMTIAVWLIYRDTNKKSKHAVAYILFFSQLALNGLWSLLFFKLHSPGWALLDLGFLLILVFVMTLYFYRIRPLAGLLLLPYVLWSSYALTLNAAIWWLNG